MRQPARFGLYRQILEIKPVCQQEVILNRPKPKQRRPTSTMIDVDVDGLDETKGNNLRHARWYCLPECYSQQLHISTLQYTPVNCSDTSTFIMRAATGAACLQIFIPIRMRLHSSVQIRTAGLRVQLALLCIACGLPEIEKNTCFLVRVEELITYGDLEYKWSIYILINVGGYSRFIVLYFNVEMQKA